MKRTYFSLLSIFLSLFILCFDRISYCAQDKSFYDDGLNEDIGVWRLRQKQLTDEEKNELDKYVEKMSEARLKEQKAQSDLIETQKKLSEFISGRDDRLEKEKTKIQDRIDRAKRKVERAQEALDKEQRDLDALEASFDSDLEHANADIDKQQKKIEDELEKNKERLERTKENKKDVSQKIKEFEHTLEKKLR